MEQILLSRPLLRLIAALSLFGAGVGTGLLAQTPHDAPQRIEQKRADLSGAPGMEVIASVAEYKPGESIDAHFHHGVEAAYVLQGTTVQAAGKPAMPIATGATMMNLREVKHGGFKVVGESSLKLFTVHVVDKKAPLYDWVK